MTSDREHILRGTDDSSFFTTFWQPSTRGTGTERSSVSHVIVREWRLSIYNGTCYGPITGYLWTPQLPASFCKCQTNGTKEDEAHTCVWDWWVCLSNPQNNVSLCVPDQLCKGQRWLDEYLVLFCGDYLNRNRPAWYVGRLVRTNHWKMNEVFYGLERTLKASPYIVSFCTSSRKTYSRQGQDIYVYRQQYWK